MKKKVVLLCAAISVVFFFLVGPLVPIGTQLTFRERNLGLAATYRDGEFPFIEIALHNPQSRERVIEVDPHEFEGVLVVVDADGHQTQFYPKKFRNKLETSVWFPPRIKVGAQESLVWKVPLNELRSENYGEDPDIDAAMRAGSRSYVRLDWVALPRGRIGFFDIRWEIDLEAAILIPEKG